MNYKQNDKVTIQSEDWYAKNKQANGFIIFKNGNKISTFSPGMVKFCGQTFTVAKVVTGSSIYPDHYTFVEDGGAYKWTDQMIAGLADGTVQTYTRESAPTPKPAAPAEPKPEVKKGTKKETPKSAPKSKPEPDKVMSVQKEEKEEKEEVWNDLDDQPEQPAPVEQPKPVESERKPEPEPQQEVKPDAQKVKEPVPEPSPEPEPIKTTETTVHEPVEQPKAKPDQPENTGEEITAFETFTILLKPKSGAALSDCAVQAFKILSANEIFPSVTFEFNNFEFNISRKNP